MLRHNLSHLRVLRIFWYISFCKIYTALPLPLSISVSARSQWLPHILVAKPGWYIEHFVLLFSFRIWTGVCYLLTYIIQGESFLMLCRRIHPKCLLVLLVLATTSYQLESHYYSIMTNSQRARQPQFVINNSRTWDLQTLKNFRCLTWYLNRHIAILIMSITSSSLSFWCNTLKFTTFQDHTST